MPEHARVRLGGRIAGGLLVALLVGCTGSAPEAEQDDPRPDDPGAGPEHFQVYDEVHQYPDHDYFGDDVYTAPELSAASPQPAWTGEWPGDVDLDARRLVEPGVRIASAQLVLRPDGRPDRLALLTTDGQQRRLRLDGIRRWRGPDGEQVVLLPGRGALSPDGRYLAVAQPGGVVVHDFETGRRQLVDVGRGRADGLVWHSPHTFWVPRGSSTTGVLWTADGRVERRGVTDETPDLAGGDEQYFGPVAVAGSSVARSALLDGAVPYAGMTDPPAVVVRRGGNTTVLPIQAEGIQGPNCPVIGWLDDGKHVAFAANAAVLVTDGRFGLWQAGEITGDTTFDDTVLGAWSVPSYW